MGEFPNIIYGTPPPSENKFTDKKSWVSNGQFLNFLPGSRFQFLDFGVQGPGRLHTSGLQWITIVLPISRDRKIERT